jgi:hypothetical protein
MLAVVTHLHAKNAAILAGYREVFQVRRELKSDLEALPEHCSRLASQYEHWGLLCSIPTLKTNYRAVADLFKARASESVADAKDILAGYDPATEQFLAQWSLFLERLKTSLEKYPPRRLDQALRAQVLDDLKRHVAALDDLSNSIRKWSDVSRSQAAGGRDPAPRPAPEPVRDDSGGASPASRPRAERPAPRAAQAAPVVRRAATRVQEPAVVDPAAARCEAELGGLLASRSRRLNSIAQVDLPALLTQYGLGDGRLPFYSERGIRDGEARPAGYAHVSYKMGRPGLFIYEEVPPGIPARSVSGDWLIIKAADLEGVAKAAQGLAAARRGPSGPATTAPRFASSRP